MEDRSNVQKPWYELGRFTKSRSGWWIEDLLVRWNEQEVTREGETEYVYDAQRIDLLLPDDVTPDEMVAVYLEATKDTIILKAQAALEQEALAD